MSITIRVTPEELKKNAMEITDEIKDLRNQYNAIEALVQKLPASWEGEAGGHHREVFREYMERVHTLLDACDRRPVQLLTMAGIYTETESRNQEMAGLLNRNIIE